MKELYEAGLSEVNYDKQSYLLGEEFLMCKIMDLQKLTDEELNAWHFDLSKDSFEIASKNGSLTRFYEIENQMAALRREWRRRINL